MNTWLAIAALAVTCVFFVWILTRQSAQQRDGTLHHPEDEQLREDADTRDAATSSPEVPWRDGHAPPAKSPPAEAAPAAVTSPPDLPQAREPASGTGKAHPARPGADASPVHAPTSSASTSRPGARSRPDTPTDTPSRSRPGA